MGLRDLARREKGSRNEVARPGERPDAGPASDITAADFSGKAITYDADMPTAFRRGAAAAGTALVARRTAAGSAGTGLVRAVKVVAPKPVAVTEQIARQVIASGARQVEKPRRSGGRVVQRRVGWQATPTMVVVTTAERELRARDDGRYAPTGPWEVEHRMTFRCAGGAAEKRVGKVAFDTPADAVASGQGEASAASERGQDDTFPEGTNALSFLPRSVRVSALARVPQPTVFDGTVLQYADAASGAVHHQEVNVIRMDAATAVVILARRDPDATLWEVSQAVYALGEPEVEQV